MSVGRVRPRSAAGWLVTASGSWHEEKPISGIKVSFRRCRRRAYLMLSPLTGGDVGYLNNGPRRLLFYHADAAVAPAAGDVGGSHPYRPQTISVTRLYHIGHRSDHIGQINIAHRHLWPHPYRPYFLFGKMSNSATGQTISAKSMSATDIFGHIHIGHTFYLEKCQIGPHSNIYFVYRANQEIYLLLACFFQLLFLSIDTWEWSTLAKTADANTASSRRLVGTVSCYLSRSLLQAALLQFDTDGRPTIHKPVRSGLPSISLPEVAYHP